MAIIYISHRMAEIYSLADRLSVFRDGEYVGELTRPEFFSERVIEMMDESLPGRKTSTNSTPKALKSDEHLASSQASRRRSSASSAALSAQMNRFCTSK
jgi:ABC-type sugar transport system ATPase subunit